MSRKNKNSYSARKKHPVRNALIVLSCVLVLFGAGAGAVYAVGSSWLQDLPNYEDASNYNYSGKTKVYANDGKTLLAEFFMENREPVTMDKISDYVLEGTVATEDERFYDHHGIDPVGVARAVMVNLTHTGSEGASSITQQFVRNTVLADEAQEHSLKRKVREAYIALRLEETYSKDEILLMYLNTINYGKGAYGIQAAAQKYYSKNASDLTLAQAATLIGIPQAPTNNNPVDNPDKCLKRRNLVLDRMLSNGYITQEEHDAAQAEKLKLKVSKSKTAADGLYKYKYFTSYVRDQLLDKYSVAEVYRNGLKVITTLDPKVQDAAEAAAKRKEQSLASSQEVAMVAVDPDTGYIKALVGGRDYDKDQYNLATQAKRQPGSAFKTFTLLAALKEGISPQTSVDCPSIAHFDNWTVHNYGNASYGTRSIASAFAVSSNTGFAQLCVSVGADKVVNMANTCGISQTLNAYPSITLGAQETTVRDMAQAYATIANGGTKHEAVCIEQVQDSQGNIVYSADTKGEKVLDTELTQAATQVMEGVITSGTGRSAALYNGQAVAGKTGTSQNWRDKWFCGITPQLSCAIWIGDRNEKPMSSSINATDVYHNFMTSCFSSCGWEVEEFPTSDKQLEYTTTDIGSGNSGDDVHDEGVTNEGETSKGTTTEEPSETEEKPAATKKPTTTTGGTSGTTTGGSTGGAPSGNQSGTTGGASGSPSG
ncbi:MAG: transglycosylase domain-containing protein, partial [Coriobacteriia bacterium]|nr:transglycosylase domain-containing protein [Coriobacteriia bacterium]